MSILMSMYDDSYIFLYLSIPIYVYDYIDIKFAEHITVLSNTKINVRS